MKILIFIIITLILTSIVSANGSGKVVVSIFIKEKPSNIIKLCQPNQESNINNEGISKGLLSYFFSNSIRIK